MDAIVQGRGNLVAPTPPAGDSSDRIANTAFVTGAIATAIAGAVTAIKNPVLVATTGSNITLSGEQTIDGVLTSASRVLVKDQTVGSQNGIYVSNAGAWSRATDMNTTGQALNETTVFVARGVLNRGFAFAIVTADPIIIGTTAIAFLAAPAPGPRWFNVQYYGATGNGVTDDTASINLAIAAFNATTFGSVLYFPAGQYLTTAALTAITADGTIAGDGMGTSGTVSGSPLGTTILNNTTNQACFTVNSLGLLIRDLAIVNTAAAGTVTTGSVGIIVTNASTAFQNVSYQNVTVNSFNIGIDIQVGIAWSMVNCLVGSCPLYSVKIRNTLSPDGGDWSIINSVFSSGIACAALIRYESSSGAKIVNCKFNGNLGSAVNTYQVGIDIVPPVAPFSIILISNCSFEGYGNVAIRVSGGNSASKTIISACEFLSQIPTASPHHIQIASTNNLILSNLCFSGSVTGVPISLTSCTDVHASNIDLIGGGQLFDNLPDNDATGGIGFGAFFKANSASAPNSYTWTAPNTATGNFFSVVSPNANAEGGWTIGNDLADNGALLIYGSTIAGDASRDRRAEVSASKGLNVVSNNAVASGGVDPVSIRAGGFGLAAEVFQALPSGKLAMTNANNFSANGAVATVLGSVGPTGSHTAVQKWLTITDGTNTFYIPCF